MIKRICLQRGKTKPYDPNEGVKKEKGVLNRGKKKKDHNCGKTRAGGSFICTIGNNSAVTARSLQGGKIR